MSEVLIVDNDNQSRHELKSIIQDSKYSFLSIYESSTAKRAMLLLKQSKPGCLITDLSLPDMDGMQFGRTALQMYPDLPVIIVTHLKMFHLVQEAINAGFSAYLLKALTRTEVIETFERVLIPELSKHVNRIMKKHNTNFVSDLSKPIESAIYIIQEHYNDSLTLKGISDQVYLSPSYFSRLFKEETGKTLVEYLADVRVQKAKSMLRMSSLPIEVIANNVGFATSGYFATTFKRLVGITPSEYREQFHWGQLQKN
ncbi:helix-turn-helix domain-containing protein [Bacillus sp. Marseille-Q3570]|uniref:response regulator transcription factor n=1 Tax=Bacillus sp. Marseille-Q3570 TaxID=2963522 RepID=UPI0021B82965|nr:helix-turn-helix domain-containing protein [Bacillus sp. Marseille-Q3570]